MQQVKSEKDEDSWIHVFLNTCQILEGDCTSPQTIDKVKHTTGVAGHSITVC